MGRNALAQESRPEGTDSLYIYRDPRVMNRWRGWIRRAKRARTGYLFSHGCERRAGRDDGQRRENVWETGYQVWGNTIQEKDHGGWSRTCATRDSTSTGKRGCIKSAQVLWSGCRAVHGNGPDRLRGGLNLYAYAPNPLSWIDPLD